MEFFGEDRGFYGQIHIFARKINPHRMKNKVLHFILGLVLLTMVTSCNDKKETTEVRKGNYRIVDNTIVFDEPQRIEGQKSVLQFTVDPIENVRIGFIGLGMRGPDAVDRMTYIDGVTVVALCDIEPDRVEAVQTCKMCSF